MKPPELRMTGVHQASDKPRSRLGDLLHRLINPFRRPKPPHPRIAMGFYTDTTVCIGCKACEVACKQWNQLPVDGFHFSGNSYDNTEALSATSWRHVKFIEQFPAMGPAPATTPAGMDGTAKAFSLPLVDADSGSGRWLMMSDVCKHCVAAPCQQACPTGALIHNEFGNVYIQPDICNGCAYCIAACPFGVITRSHFDGHAHKCTLCYDRQRDGLVPACAKACPTQSIQFGPIDELRARAEKRVEDLHSRGVASASLYGKDESDTYSALHSFYLLVDSPSTYGLPEKPFNPWLNMPGDYLRAVGAGLATLVLFLAALFFLGR